MYKFKKRSGCMIFVLMLLFFARPSRAQEAQQIIPDDLKNYLSVVEVSSDDVEYFDDALVIDNMVYQYQAKTDSFTMCYVLGKKKRIVLEDYILGRPVTAIGYFVFYDGYNSNVRELILPDTFREPLCMDNGYGARITSLVLPEGMTDPGHVPTCRYLRWVTLPETAVKTGEFSGCKRLETINLPSGLQEVSELAFSHCVSLKEMALPNGIKKIGGYAFYGCKNLSLYIPPSVKKIKEKALDGIRMLYCVKGSAAHRYAKKNRIHYKLVSGTKTKAVSLKVSSGSLSAAVGEKGRLAVRVRPIQAGGRQLRYKSSRPKVVSVSKNGEWSALARGNAVITVTSAVNRKAFVKVKIRVRQDAPKGSRAKKR